MTDSFSSYNPESRKLTKSSHIKAYSSTSSLPVFRVGNNYSNERSNESTNSLLISDEYISYYCGLLEYSQIASIKTVVEINETTIAEINDFKTFVVNIPTERDYFEIEAAPISMISSFKTISFISISGQILDVDARGFCRKVVLALAHKNRSIIESLYDNYHEMLTEFITSLQDHSRTIFLEDLRVFIGTLKYALVMYPDYNSILQNKLDSISSMISNYQGFDISLIDPVEKPLSYFIRINNNLRGIDCLTPINIVWSLMEEFVSRLPKTLFGYNVISKIPNQEMIQLGDSNLFLSKPDFDINDNILSRLISSGVLHGVLFSLLSGLTLVICSENIGKASELAQMIMSIIPLFNKNDLAIYVNEPLCGIEYLRYSIVVS